MSITQLAKVSYGRSLNSLNFAITNSKLSFFLKLLAGDWYQCFLILSKRSKLLKMKKIEAIIRLSRFEKVRDALADIGVNFFTLTEVRGYGLQKGEKLVYRGSSYDTDYIARLQLDILTTEDRIDDIITAITKSGRTGEVGDGKIIVYDVEHVVRIRTGEVGAEAI